ncbi:MAG: hypothetical protein ACM362_13455 [Candidatus Methylomirabilota bacterium]
MKERRQIQMVFHGAIVVFLGLLFGLPFGVGVAAGWREEPVQAWRVAHAGMVAVGMLLIAIGAALRHLVLGQRQTSWLVWSLVASAYAFTLAVLLRGVGGAKGFQPTGPILNWIAFLSNMVGIVGSLVGVALTIRGASTALRKPLAE